MGNCLVTKLKGTSSNYMLPLFNHIALNFECESAGHIAIARFGSESSIQFNSILANQEGFSEIQTNANPTISMNTWADLAAKDYNLNVPIGEITGIELVGTDNNNNRKVCFNLDKSYFPKYSLLKVFRLFENSPAGVKGGIVNLCSKFPELTELSIPRNTGITGKLSDLQLCPDLELVQLQLAVVTGSFNDLIPLLKLENVLIDSLPGYNSRSEYINGITQVAVAQVSRGRTSGTLYIRNDYSHSGNYTPAYINYGSSMVNPTSEETSQGYQIKDGVPS